MQSHGAQDPFDDSFLTSIGQDFEQYDDFAELNSLPSNDVPLPQLEFSAGGEAAAALPQVRRSCADTVPD